MRKTYSSGALEVQALRGVTLRIDAGRVRRHHRARPGSGKSTLMHILGCLDVPTAGTYRLAGEDVERHVARTSWPTVRNRRIGFVFQQFNLLAVADRLAQRRAAAVYAGGRPRRAPRRARSPRWTGSGWPTGPSTGPASCPAASSSGSPSPGRWSPTRA